MTFGRPVTIPSSLVPSKLPLDCHLQCLASGSLGRGAADVDRPSTVCHFIATSCVLLIVHALVKALISSRRLYLVIGDILLRLYGNNLALENKPPFPSFLADFSDLERRLDSIEEALPDVLRLRYTDSQNGTTWNPSEVFLRLSTITRLRVLNVRLLLYRAALGRALASTRAAVDSSSADYDPLLIAFAHQTSFKAEACAVETIRTVYELRNRQHLLGSWWFTIYYGNSLPSPSVYIFH
jgi:hypothetical protein